jgi:hypothetical protein
MAFRTFVIIPNFPLRQQRKALVVSGKARPFLMARLVKYILNLGALIWLSCAAPLSYGLIVRFPSCDQVMCVIWSNVWDLAKLYLLFIVIAFVVNRFAQKKIERRTQSKDHIYIGLVQLVVFTGATFYFSYDFYLHCGLKV